jgi:hypothetical protein
MRGATFRAVLAVLLSPLLLSTSFSAATVTPFPALFVSGVFDGTNVSSMEAAALDIASAGFSSVTLSFLHVHADSSLWFNDIPVANATFLPRAVQIIKGIRRGAPPTLLLSIGGAGTDDFDNIAAHWANFNATFPPLLRALDIDGFDVDIEGGDWPGPTLTKLLQLGVREKFTMTATPPAVAPEGNWLDLIASTRADPPRDNTSCLARLQLQTYTSFPVEPGVRVKEWVAALGPLLPPSQLGAGFVVPGFEVVELSPTSEGEVTAWVRAAAAAAGPVPGPGPAAPAVQGAFVWEYADMPMPGGRRVEGGGAAPLRAAGYASGIRAAFAEEAAGGRPA